jgi:hypothetical protein
MPLLEVNPSRHVSASIRLEEATAIQIDQYAAFIHASADDVVDKALNYVFSKDREFQEYLKLADAARIPPSLRIRRSAHNGATPEAPLQSAKPVKALEVANDLRPRN